MKFFVIFLLAIISVAGFSQLTQNSFGVESENIANPPNDKTEVKTILEKNPVVIQFLKSQPSSSNDIYQTTDEFGNLVTKSEYHHERLGLVVSLEKENNGFFVKSYDVSYEIPTLGIGVSLTSSQYFESDQVQQAILAVKDLTNPHKQMKKGIPLFQIQCKEGLYSIVKRDRVTPACVTAETEGELLRRGWTPLRIGMPAETNILITYNATMVYPQKVTKEFTLDLPFNMIFWVNNDIVPHTVVANDGSWSTGQIESGKIGSMRFNQTGSFSYYILEKPDTSGRITFENPEPEPIPEPIPETIEETNFNSNLYYEEFGPGSPLIYLDTFKPVLDYDNCLRYAYWLTEHQKEKTDKSEDYPRYPPWGNQIFPLVDYCTANGELVKLDVGDKIQWNFNEIYPENSTKSLILKYNPVLFEGTGTGLQGEELENYIREKRKQMDVAFDELGVKGLYPITGESFSFDKPAYSLDQWYVGDPIALDIHILKEEFTKENLIKTNELVRKYVGDEIDIVYSKGVYVSFGSKEN